MKHMRQHLEESAAATKLQGMYRKRRAKLTLFSKKLEMNEKRAALVVQRQWRAKKGRSEYKHKLHDKHEKDAATLMQSRMRGRAARAEVKKMRHQKELDDAAEKMQAVYRGMHGRREALEKRRAVEAKRMKRDRSAIKIQSQFRRHRCQVKFELRIVSFRLEQEEKAGAATKVQSLWRGKQDRAAFEARRGGNMDEMVEEARYYKETWDDDNQQHFYFNEDTQEALWEVPPSGYVKKDGVTIVLRTGSEIRDPRLAPLKKKRGSAGGSGGGSGGSDDDDDDDVTCVECEKVEATRKCVDCDDQYCESCYAHTHATGSRVNHTWEPMGTLKCMECEEEAATRWCIECDDPYCDDCFAYDKDYIIFSVAKYLH